MSGIIYHNPNPANEVERLMSLVAQYVYLQPCRCAHLVEVSCWKCLFEYCLKKILADGETEKVEAR